MMFGESSKALNSSAPKLVISNRMSIHFSVRFRGACPIKFDYLQFDFSACSSSDGEKENERSHKSVFRGVKWFQSNRVFFCCFVFATPSPFALPLVIWCVRGTLSHPSHRPDEHFLLDYVSKCRSRSIVSVSLSATNMTQSARNHFAIKWADASRTSA